jgi:hypothetical protein
VLEQVPQLLLVVLGVGLARRSPPRSLRGLTRVIAAGALVTHATPTERPAQRSMRAASPTSVNTG